MGLFSRKSETTTEPSKPLGKLPASMPTRLPNDPRGKGHETDYQASRGGWLKKGR
jgi:hypothetical protein